MIRNGYISRPPSPSTLSSTPSQTATQPPHREHSEREEKQGEGREDRRQAVRDIGGGGRRPRLLPGEGAGLLLPRGRLLGERIKMPKRGG